MSMISLLAGLYSHIDTAVDTNTTALRNALTYYNFGDVPTDRPNPPYMNWMVIPGTAEDYVMGDPDAIYSDPEIRFGITTREKSSLTAGNLAESLKKSISRGNFTLTDGRVIDAVVVDDAPIQNSDSDGWTWFVSFEFTVGT